MSATFDTVHMPASLADCRAGVEAARAAAAPAPFVSSLAATMPELSNWLNPTTADLIVFVTYLQTLADGCNIGAEAGQLGNPFATIGALRANAATLKLLLERRQREEERNLLLLDRLAHEAADEPREVPYDGRDAATGIALYGEI